jgi:DNA-binding MarR family transcriptional regulator
MSSDKPSTKGGALRATVLPRLARFIDQAEAENMAAAREVAALAQFLYWFVYEPLQIEAGLSLCVSQAAALQAIGAGEGVKIGDVADRLSYTTGATTRAIDVLVNRGLVVRERSEVDRRVVFVALTQAGRGALAAWSRHGNRLLAEGLEHLAERRIGYRLPQGCDG